MTRRLRPLVQWSLFLLFLGLMFTGKAQIWMAFIFISIGLATFFGRFYCGWACPINTLIRPVNWVKLRLGIGKSDMPMWLKTGRPRRIAFGFFLVGLSYTIYTITQGQKFPLPLIIIPIGLAVTLLINEEAWHRYLCPWGFLFSLTGRLSKLGIVSSVCSSCSLCTRNCPTGAIKVTHGQRAVVDSAECILCMECTAACPLNGLSYRPEQTTESAQKSA